MSHTPKESRPHFYTWSQWENLPPEEWVGTRGVFWHSDGQSSARVGFALPLTVFSAQDVGNALWTLAGVTTPVVALEGEPSAFIPTEEAVFPKTWLFDAKDRTWSSITMPVSASDALSRLLGAALKQAGVEHLADQLITSERGAQTRVEKVKGGWWVAAGSVCASKDPTKSFPFAAKVLAQQWVNEGILVQEAGRWVFAQAVLCPSLALLASVVLRTDGRLSHWQAV